MELEPIETIVYQCPVCKEYHKTEREADFCIYKHYKEKCIENDWNYGFDLNYINYIYGLHMDLTPEQKNINKDTCFVISWLQCSDLPCYKITEIKEGGHFTVWGCGSWSGHKAFDVTLNDLKNPLPESKFKEYEG